MKQSRIGTESMMCQRMMEVASVLLPIDPRVKDSRTYVDLRELHDDHAQHRYELARKRAPGVQEVVAC